MSWKGQTRLPLHLPADGRTAQSRHHPVDQLSRDKVRINLLGPTDKNERLCVPICFYNERVHSILLEGREAPRSRTKWS